MLDYLISAFCAPHKSVTDEIAHRLKYLIQGRREGGARWGINVNVPILRYAVPKQWRRSSAATDVIQYCYPVFDLISISISDMEILNKLVDNWV